MLGRVSRSNVSIAYHGCLIAQLFTETLEISVFFRVCVHGSDGSAGRVGCLVGYMAGRMFGGFWRVECLVGYGRSRVFSWLWWVEGLAGYGGSRVFGLLLVESVWRVMGSLYGGSN